MAGRLLAAAGYRVDLPSANGRLKACVARDRALVSEATEVQERSLPRWPIAALTGDGAGPVSKNGEHGKRVRIVTSGLHHLKED